VLERLAGDSRELLRLTLTRYGRLVWIDEAPGAPPGLMSPVAMIALGAAARQRQGVAGDARRIRRAEDPARLRSPQPTRGRQSKRPVMRAAPARAAGW
jgi:hypothetical protein